jgi:hypothetical protein
MAEGAPVQSSDALFKKVLPKLGLAMIIGPGTLKRSLAQGGVDWSSATADDYRRALPYLEERLRNYMEPAEARRRIGEILALLAG